MLNSRFFRALLIPTIAIILAVAWLSADLRSQTAIWVLIGIALLAAAAHAWRIFRRVAGPLESIRHVVEQMRAGRLSERAHVDSFDEWENLALAVNALGKTLSERIAKLEQRDARHAQAEQLLQAVLRTMSEGVVVVGRDQRILFSNEAARPLFDRDSGDVVGRPLWEVARSPHVQDLVRPVLELGGHRQTEFELSRSRTLVAATATALPSQPVPGAVLMVQNVTELRRLEKLRQDFVSNVSHELKTPLTTIQACADTLLEGAIDDPQRHRQFLEQIVEQSERLHDLILDLLRLAKIESQQEAFDIRAVELAGPIAACLEAHQTVAIGKDVELTGECADEPIRVRADADELRTILDNLVGNALNYTPPGGRIVVRSLREGEFARISVEDTGVGISKEQQSRIFERFYRADRARDRLRGGTGLGLAIVKHLAQLFGGTVEVSSELGRGSTFTVRLPAVDDRVDADERDAGEAAPSIRSPEDERPQQNAAAQ